MEPIIEYSRDDLQGSYADDPYEWRESHRNPIVIKQLADVDGHLYSVILRPSSDLSVEEEYVADTEGRYRPCFGFYLYKDLDLIDAALDDQGLEASIVIAERQNPIKFGEVINPPFIEVTVNVLPGDFEAIQEIANGSIELTRLMNECISYLSKMIIDTTKTNDLNLPIIFNFGVDFDIVESNSERKSEGHWIALRDELVSKLFADAIAFNWHYRNPLENGENVRSLHHQARVIKLENFTK